jgi:hypothetical protein
MEKSRLRNENTNTPPKKKIYNPTSTAPTSETNARYKIKAMQDDSSTVNAIVEEKIVESGVWVLVCPSMSQRSPRSLRLASKRPGNNFLFPALFSH